jgi:hypothetical protein
MFIECQQGLINSDYIVHVSLPARSTLGGVFSITRGDGYMWHQEFTSLAAAERAFKHLYDVLITNNG